MFNPVNLFRTPPAPVAGSFEAAKADQAALHAKVDGHTSISDAFYAAIDKVEIGGVAALRAQSSLSQVTATPIVINATDNIVVRGAKKYENGRRNLSAKIAQACGGAAEKAGEKVHAKVYKFFSYIRAAFRYIKWDGVGAVLQNVVAFGAAFLVRSAILAAGYLARGALLLPYVVVATALAVAAIIAGKYIAAGFVLAAATYGVFKVVTVTALSALGITAIVNLIATGRIAKLLGRTPAQTQGPSLFQRCVEKLNVAKNFVLSKLPKGKVNLKTVAVAAGVVAVGGAAIAFGPGLVARLIGGTPETDLPQVFGNLTKGTAFTGLISSLAEKCGPFKRDFLNCA